MVLNQIMKNLANMEVNLVSIICVISLLSFTSYTAAYTRRILIPKYDERMLIVFEATLVFLVTMLFIFVTSYTGTPFFPTSKKSLISSFKQFKTNDFKTILIGASAVAFIAIFWIYIIRYNELSKLLLTKQALDILFAIGGSYLLLREQITIRKLIAFVLMLFSVHLLAN